jgi:hypothetical protein
MTFNEPVVLGRTGLKVGRLGIASGYKAPAAAIEEAYERVHRIGDFVHGPKRA